MAGELILIVEDTQSVAKLVATYLETAGYAPEISLSGQEALERIRHSQPDLFIIDVMMPGMDGFQLTRQLRSNPKTQNTPIVILTARDSLDDKVKGFEAGADDYVIKPFEAAELLVRVKALLSRRRPPTEIQREEPDAGNVIAAFGLRGGAGRSSLVANLAVGLADALEEQVAICDLSLESGHQALLLDARPMRTIDELVTRYGTAFESDVLLGYLTETSYGVQIMAAPNSPASAPLVTAEGVRALIDQLQQRFPFVLLDLAPTFNDLNLSVLEFADQILVVTTPEMGGIQATSSVFEILDSLGYEPERAKLVVSTVFAAAPINLSDIVAALHKQVDLDIPYDRRAFVDAINRGIPVVRSAPRSAPARAILSYAAKLVGATVAG